MLLLLAASAHAACPNLVVTPPECGDGDRVRVTVDCDDGPLPEGWHVELQQDGGDYGRLVELGELVNGAAEGVCVDPGLPCGEAQTSYLYAVATDARGGQSWAYARLRVKGGDCDAEDARGAEDDGTAGLAPPEAEATEDTAAGPRAEAAEDEEPRGCGASGLASAGLLLLGLGSRRRR